MNASLSPPGDGASGTAGSVGAPVVTEAEAEGAWAAAGEAGKGEKSLAREFPAGLDDDGEPAMGLQREWRSGGVKRGRGGGGVRSDEKVGARRLNDKK